ncbi:choice-of-anchor D domain-containing protein [Pseudonocardia sp. CA-107938]|uniref:choice-of-anchor D domain-containing protein n=1 Tax=Pseudonocardia sp. CA-107938 TaxID=3240021 RepID=UPI003D903075
MGGALGDVHADVHVAGDMQGQIAVGNNIVQIGVMHGNVVVPATSIPQPVRRPEPLRVIPRPPVPFHGRRTEAALLVAEARTGRVVAVQGPPGIGRSTLLRHVATHRDLASVIYFSARDATLDDAVQMLFEACYSSVTAVKPTLAQARLWLGDIRAAVVVDDIPAAHVTRLVDVAPRCGFVVAPVNGGPAGVRSVPLSGLATDEARALLEHGLGRPLLPSETYAADRLCMLAGNAPNRVLAAAAAARNSGRPLPEFAESAWTGGQPGPRPTGVERRLLDVLAAVPGALLDERWLAMITGVPDAGARLARAAASGLVEHVPDLGFRATGWATSTEQARACLVDHAVRWAQARDGRAHRPSTTVEALRCIQADCARRGEWRAVLDLGRVLDPSYAQSGRWDAWHDVLTTNLTAAQAMGDRAAEALALHQLGTRELCLAGTAAAASLLAAALAIRQAIGDTHGAAATGHNLSILPSAPTPIPLRRPRATRHAHHVRTAVAVAATAVIGASMTATVVLASASPSVAFEPAGISFQAQPVNQPGTVQSISLINHGSATAHLTGIRSAGTDATDFEITDTNCGTELPPGQSCRASITFTPVAEGERQAKLALDTADGAPIQAHLSGTGSPPIGPTSDPPAVVFGPQEVGTGSTPFTVTLTAPASGTGLGSLVPDGPAAADYQLVADTCSHITAPAGGTCTFAVLFTPSATGTRSASVQIPATDGRVVATVPVRGTGTPPRTATPVPVGAVVPRTIGMPLAAAQNAISAARLRPGAVTSAPSDTVPAGSVVSSSPPAGTSLAPGSQVRLVTSSGAAGCTVPQLVGLTIEAAKAAIARSCGVLGEMRRGKPSLAVKQATVTSTDPPAGTTLAKGEPVQLAVSTPGVSVPNVDVDDHTIEDAEREIKKANLVVGTVPKVVKTGDKLGTSPGLGTVVAVGSAVNIIIVNSD